MASSRSGSEGALGDVAGSSRRQRQRHRAGQHGAHDRAGRGLAPEIDRLALRSTPVPFGVRATARRISRASPPHSTTVSAARKRPWRSTARPGARRGRGLKAAAPGGGSWSTVAVAMTTSCGRLFRTGTVARSRADPGVSRGPRPQVHRPEQTARPKRGWEAGHPLKRVESGAGARATRKNRSCPGMSRRSAART
jgi:hypothetical protein